MKTDSEILREIAKRAFNPPHKELLRIASKLQQQEESDDSVSRIFKGALTSEKIDLNDPMVKKKLSDTLKAQDKILAQKSPLKGGNK